MVVIAIKYNDILVWIYPGSLFPPQTFTNASDRNPFKCLPSEYKYEQLGPGRESFLLFSPLLCISIWLVCLSGFGSFVLLVCRCMNFNEHSTLVWTKYLETVQSSGWETVLVFRLFRSHFKSSHLWKISSFYSKHMSITSLSLISGFAYHVFNNSLCPYFLLHLVPLFGLFLSCPFQIF